MRTSGGSLWVRSENNVAGHDHAYRPTWADLDCRLDVEVAVDDALAGFIQCIGRTAPNGAFDVTIAIAS